MEFSQEIRLIKFVEAYLGRACTWGECDCNIFVLLAWDAVFGTNIAIHHRGKYKTSRGAIRYRRRSKWGSLQVLLADEAGAVEIPQGFQQAGDILIVPDDKWEMAHLCIGDKIVSADPDDLVSLAPITALVNIPYQVWRYQSCLQQ